MLGVVLNLHHALWVFSLNCYFVIWRGYLDLYNICVQHNIGLLIRIHEIARICWRKTAVHSSMSSPKQLDGFKDTRHIISLPK